MNQMQRSMKGSSTIGSFLPMVKDAAAGDQKHTGLKIKVNKGSLQNGGISTSYPNSAINHLESTQHTDNRDIKAQRYTNIQNQQSKYVNKIQDLLLKAPFSEYSNKNLTSLHKMQRNKLGQMNIEYNDLNKALDVNTNQTK